MKIFSNGVALLLLLIKTYSPVDGTFTEDLRTKIIPADSCFWLVRAINAEYEGERSSIVAQCISENSVAARKKFIEDFNSYKEKKEKREREQREKRERGIESNE